MAKFVFEVAWEVCNRVGDVHTTLATKARKAVEQLGDANYIVVGPNLDKNTDFSEQAFDGSESFLQALAAKGIAARAGRWNIPGNPRCVVLNYRDVITDQDRLLYHMWEDFGVDSMFGQWDYIEPVLFSTVCGMAVETMAGKLSDSADVAAHFHEWTAGAGLLYLKQAAPQISTVFTAHSTVLGRCIGGSGGDIYMIMDEIDSAQESKKHGVSAKFSLEGISARQADCFTAVSQLAANESLALLGINPPVVTPNALDLRAIPDYARDLDTFRSRRTSLVGFASKFLNRPLKPESTRLLVCAGRYEFQSKGIDVILEALKALEDQLRKTPGSDTQVVTFLLLQGGGSGVHEEALRRVQNTFQGADSDEIISTHNLIDKHSDPVLNTCRKLSLLNRKDNRCHVILVPATLDGNDGIINIAHNDVLLGCDAGLFPSNYDPAGYSALECAAHAVPTVTTDKSGFGEWVLENFASKPGVHVLERQGQTLSQTASDLAEWLTQFVGWDEAKLVEWKRAARAIAAQADWAKSYASYQEAYQKSELGRQDRMAGMRKQQEDGQALTYIAPTNSNQPRMRSLSVVSELPKELKLLEDIAYSMWWVWNRDARELFKRLDPLAWERLISNPVSLLQQLDESKISEALNNETYMQLYQNVASRFKSEMTGTPCRIEALKTVTRKSPIAYFSMEFGIHECMPIYSGGLGILSGDHLKSASDLNIPLVGIGLLYKFGYFVQRVNRAGDQVPIYEENNFAQLPIKPMARANGQKVKIGIDLPGRTVFAQVWVAQVGTVPLYLMDTDVDENSQKDRYLTSKLYDSSTRERIEQEILLGIGGVTTLRALGIEPSVYHLNEGHSAFLLVEQLRLLMKDQGLDFDTAREVVRARSVFTTHTPVPAGNERFHRSLIENYFRPYIDGCGMTWEQFWNLGHVYSGEESDFEMTVLALKMCSHYNGVSRLHGEVARGMWQHVWRGFLPNEVRSVISPTVFTAVRGSPTICAMRLRLTQASPWKTPCSTRSTGSGSKMFPRMSSGARTIRSRTASSSWCGRRFRRNGPAKVRTPRLSSSSACV